MDNQSTPPLTEPVQPETGDSVVKKSGSRLESVQADVVEIDTSNVDTVNATNVTMRNSGVRQVNGQSITVNNSGIGIMHGSSVSVNDGGMGICSVTDANVNGNVGMMIGQSVTLNNHRTGLVVTREVHSDHVQSIFFLAGRSDGPVETILDQRSVALFGLASGIAMGLVLSLFRLLKR
jgi:hypothetical protein